MTTFAEPFTEPFDGESGSSTQVRSLKAQVAALQQQVAQLGNTPAAQLQAQIDALRQQVTVQTELKNFSERRTQLFHQAFRPTLSAEDDARFWRMFLDARDQAARETLKSPGNQQNLQAILSQR